VAVGVSVVVVVVPRVSDHFADRHYAAMDDFAVGVFKLDGGVVDVEISLWPGR
jgi:hypothetical protein